MKNKIFNYIIAFLILLIIIVTYFVLNKKEEVIFTINENRITLKINEKKKIDYSISNPDIVISWKVSNPKILSIDNNGTIQAKEIGEAIVTGTIIDDDVEKHITCFVIIRAENYDIPIVDITIPNGEILLSVNDNYSIPITYIPDNGYIESTDYIIEDNTIIKEENGLITALKPGYTTLSIIVNNSIIKDIVVNVTENEVTSNIINQITDVTFNTNETIYINDTKKLDYNIEPNNGTIYDIKWNSSNSDIVSISNDGTIKGLKTGESTIEIEINNRIKRYINVKVKAKIDSIKLDYNPKSIIKVDDTFTLYPTLSPSNTQAKIIYESSNPAVLAVSQDGIVKAINQGSAIITIKSEDNTVSKKISFTILPNKGVMNTDKYVWAFSKDTDVTPKRAGTEFFTELAKRGKGTISNGIYLYKNYSYNISSNLLTIGNNRKIFMRIYYPENKELSSLNTFTYIGGAGETNFGGSMVTYDKNPSLIKNSGILIFIPESNKAKVYGANVAEATNFVKEIINQNKNARNTIGGYSNGGPPCGDAIKNGNYNKVMIIDSSFYWVKSIPNAKNLEYVIYSPQGDSWRGTGSFIGELRNFGVKNITVVTNNESIVNQFKSSYLVINPGKSMKNGHTSDNLVLSHFFSYGVD